MPLFHAAWLFALGVAASEFVWLRPTVVLIALGLAAVVCAAAAFVAQRVAWLPVALIWFLLGAWCAEMQPQPQPAPILSAMSDGLLRTVEGTVIDAGPVRGQIEQNLEEYAPPAVTQSPTQRIDLKLDSIEKVTDDEDRQVPADGAVRLTVRWASDPSQPIRCGERIRALARLLPPEVYRDPGAWNRREYLVQQGITSTASVAIDRIDRLGQAPLPRNLPAWQRWLDGGGSLHCRLSGAQQMASNRLLALPGLTRGMPKMFRIGPDDAVMLAAMVTGDRTFLSHSLRVGFERTGSFHMLVVSGFHLAIVAGCIFWVARIIRLPRAPATLLTLGASFAYALFTGFAIPVQRSLWMVTLYMLGRLVYRERSPMNTIGFAALCLMVADPRALFDSGFQMTLLAVVSIGGVASPLLRGTVHPYLTATRDLRLVEIDPKLPPPEAEFRVMLRLMAAKLEGAIHRVIGWQVFPRMVRFSIRICELLVVACVVELAMMLPMALYFHRITIVALPVNMLIFPLLLVLMPVAGLTLLALLVWPLAAALPAAATALLLHFGVGMVHLFGSLALGDVRIPAPLAWQSAAFCALLGAAILLARGGRWLRRGAWAALALAGVTAVLPRAIDHPRDAMLVEAIDVGQGDSLLVITPDGKTLLVDGGGFGGGPRQAPQEFDIGEEVVSPALWSRGIRRLDAVALSHAHSDHMGGLPAVLNNFRPAELWVGNNPHSPSYDALLAEAADLSMRVRSFRSGDEVSLGSARLHVLAPLPGYQPGLTANNNDSLVFRAAFGSSSVLFEGDAEAPVEDAMLAEPDLASTLLKVGHHGSVTSSRPEFLARVAPRWAVISCGLHNRFGHPRQEVLSELEQAGVRTYSTDIQGATCFRLDGKDASADPGCQGR